jgi:hypothetical protein
MDDWLCGAHADGPATLCDVTEADTGERWTACVQVSEDPHPSANLLVDLLPGRNLKRGTILHLHFRIPSGGTVRPRDAFVIYSWVELDGQLIVHCALDSELSPDEMRLLLRARGGALAGPLRGLLLQP